MPDSERRTVGPITTVDEPEGHRSVHPMPSQADLDAFYRDVYFQTVPTTAYSLSYSDEELAQRQVRAAMLVHTAIGNLAAHCPGSRSASFFDIGFGEGFELAAAQAAGLAVGGVDYTSDALTRLHPELIDAVRTGNPLAALSTMNEASKRHDIVVLRNVLEHVRDPRAVLRSAATVTAPGGVIVVTVPNDFTPIQEELRARNLVDREYWLAPPQHLQYFRSDRFADFAECCGLRMVDLFGDFPIEVFLFHPASNYIRDTSQGKAAHQARIMLDLLCARHGLERFTAFCRASAAIGMIRTFTAFLVQRQP